MITLLLLCVVAMPVLAQPTHKDLAWEAAAGYGGALVGGVVAGIASIPFYVQVFNSDICEGLSAVEPDVEFPDMSEQEACGFRTGERLVTTSMTLSTIGMGLGSVGGVVLAARAQGHTDGNLLAASGAALVGSLATLQVSLAMYGSATESIALTGQQAEISPLLYAASLVLSVLSIALIIIGYHYL